ncbi:MAG: hypothetical protein JWQ34_3161 [Mucilaginibacter sp.]|uniref:hypothetical protein n=1 Tax=Mucilaginibacter sp. TaxID=1882438 RepID=UPI0026149384|nr:hypothetical protein [Mucilaginibacter sp.]MDB5004936.1 hypothetical protein [Mucilaginibacter sp.]
MKKILLTLAIAIFTQFSYAQFNTSSGNTTTMDNVGIGTTSPQALVHINSGTTPSNSQFRISTNGQGSLSALNFAPDNTSIGFDVDFSSGGWIARNSSVASLYKAGGLFRIMGSSGNTVGGSATLNDLLDINLSSGNVGIGTTSPGAKLQINSPAGAAYAPVLSFTEGGNPTYGFSFLQDDLTTGDLQLNRVNAGTSTQLLTFQRNTGYVGIGTTNPEAPLTVYGKSLFFPRRIGAGDARSFQVDYDISNPDFISNDYPIVLKTGGGNQPLILDAARIGIGTTTPDAKLTVNGTIHSKEVKVDLNVPGPDYVFNADYKPITLSEIKDYVVKNHHLPEIPSAAQMAKEGINLGDMNTKLLKKVEELTLYAIDQQKQIELLKQQQEKSKQQDERIAVLEKALAKLTDNK